MPVINLPGPDDRHVLAAAIKGGASAIITFNLKDFPEAELSKYDVEPLHPDEFILHQFGLDTAGVITAAQRCRARLKNPPKTAAEFLETLEQQSLPLTVAELQPWAAVL